MRNIKGKKFNRLTVIRFSYKNKNSVDFWECECDCGNTKIIRGHSIEHGLTKSCGCLQKEKVKITGANCKKHGFANKERLYRIWKNMRKRCNNPNSDYYENYGGRGIKVCEEWNDYQNFRNWSLDNGYQDDLSIDRINGNEGYEPSNCRWANRKQQANNQRSNVMIFYKGEIKTAAQWAEKIGITKSSMYHRLDRGWTMEEIEKIPQGERRNRPSKKALVFEFDGKKRSLKELSEISGIKPMTINSRIKKGWSVEKAINTPLMKNKFG